MSRTNTRGQGRCEGQLFEDKDDDENKIFALRPTLPGGLNISDTLYLM